MYVCIVCLSVYVFVCVCFSVYVCMCVCVSERLSVYVCVCVSAYTNKNCVCSLERERRLTRKERSRCMREDEEKENRY